MPEDPVPMAEPTPQPLMPTAQRRSAAAWLMPAALALLLVLAYWGLWQFDFINVDDAVYVFKNPVVSRGLTWQGLSYAFHPSSHWQYHPLSFLSHMLDVQLFGLWPGGHHLTNLALHLATTLLLGLLLRRLGLRLALAWFLAGVWALHPLRVESVAWVAERKDVLSGLLALATLHAYVSYAQAPGLARYALVFLGLLAGLLAKPMLVTLPVVLLLLDHWPLGRLRQAGDIVPRVLEKLPLLLLSAGFALLTLLAARQHNAMSEGSWTLSSRLEICVTGYAAYLQQTLWPANLAMLYPVPLTRHAGEVLSAAALLTLVSTLAWKWRLSCPWFLVGWLWFVIMLLPVSGLMQAGNQIRADRFTYLPHLGLILAIGMLCDQACTRLRTLAPRLAPLPVLASVACLLALGATSFSQSRIWRGTQPLLEHTLAVTTPNAPVHIYYAKWLSEQQQMRKAMQQYIAAVVLDARGSYLEELGAHMLQMGQPQAGALYYRMAANLQPGNGQVRADLAGVLIDLGKTAEAQIVLAQAYPLLQASIRDQPGNALHRHSLGRTLLLLGRTDEAAAEFQTALALDPRLQVARFNLADLEYRRDRIEQAIALWEGGFRLQRSAYAAYRLGSAFVTLRQFRQAVPWLEQSLELDPRQVPAMILLARVYAASSDPAVRQGERARLWAQRACELTGGKHAGALEALAAAEAELGHFEFAAQMQRRSIATAEAAGLPVSEAMRQRLKLYESRQGITVP